MMLLGVDGVSDTVGVAVAGSAAVAFQAVELWAELVHEAVIFLRVVSAMMRWQLMW